MNFSRFSPSLILAGSALLVVLNFKPANAFPAEQTVEHMPFVVHVGYTLIEWAFHYQIMLLGVIGVVLIMLFAVWDYVNTHR